MGGKSGGGFGDTAVQQGEANEGVVRDQTYANRPAQYTPWGYTNWTSEAYTDPGSGEQTTRWSQMQGLTPELQALLDKQIALQGGKSDVAGGLVGRMGAEFGQPMDWGGLNPLRETPQEQYTLPEGDVGDPNMFRQRAEDAMYSSAQSRLSPKFQEQRRALEAKMRNQGIGPEDAAWQAQMGAIGTQETDAYNQAQWGATEAGRAESGQMFGQALSRNQNAYQQAYGANQANFGQSMQTANYANQIRQQQMTEAMTKRGFSLNEINALMSGGQVGTPQMPNFSQAGAAQPMPWMQGYAQDQSMAGASNPMSGLMGMGGQALGGYLSTLSDRRMKFNIQRMGTRNGYPWYSYNLKYDGSAHEGVMADEIPQEHVIDIGGIKLVNYGTLLGE